MDHRGEEGQDNGGVMARGIRERLGSRDLLPNPHSVGDGSLEAGANPVFVGTRVSLGVNLTMNPFLY